MKRYEILEAICQNSEKLPWESIGDSGRRYRAATDVGQIKIYRYQFETEHTDPEDHIVMYIKNGIDQDIFEFDSVKENFDHKKSLWKVWENARRKALGADEFAANFLESLKKLTKQSRLSS